MRRSSPLANVLVFGFPVFAALLGCDGGRASQNAEPAAPAAHVYGALVLDDSEVVSLAEVVSAPERFDGMQIRTEGHIERVCQKRGCWLELVGDGGARAFVPMAGHAFTVPMGSAGAVALVEGTVHRRERSQAERDHLKSDGAGDSIPSLSIEATGVAIR